MSGMQTARFTRLGLGLHSSLHCTAWPGSSFAPNYALPVWLRLVVYVLCNGIVGLTMSVGGCQAPERRRIAVSAPSYQVIDTLPAWNLPGRTLTTVLPESHLIHARPSPLCPGPLYLAGRRSAGCGTDAAQPSSFSFALLPRPGRFKRPKVLRIVDRMWQMCSV